MPTYWTRIIDSDDGANQTMPWIPIDVHGPTADGRSKNITLVKQTVSGAGTQFMRMEMSFDDVTPIDLAIFPGAITVATTAFNLYPKSVRFRLNGIAGSSVVAVGILAV